MLNELDIVRDVSARLERGGIAYMLTGSMAMNYYAQPRMTRDIDVVVALEPRDVEAVVHLFSPDYYLSREAVSTSIAQESMFNLIHQESIIKVDCIVRKSTPYRQAEFERPAADHNRRFLHLDHQQGRPDYFETGLGEGFCFRAAISRRKEPCRNGV
jgi:hypothetical protein